MHAAPSAELAPRAVATTKRACVPTRPPSRALNPDRGCADLASVPLAASAPGYPGLDNTDRGVCIIDYIPWLIKEIPASSPTSLVATTLTSNAVSGVLYGSR